MLAVFILPAVFACAVAPFPALAQAPAVAYLVKLKQANPAALENLGFNVKHQFIFSSDGEFQNIYSLDSVRSLPQLQSALAGQADYVQTDNGFQAVGQIYNPSSYVTAQFLTVNDPGFTSNPLNIDREWAIPAVGFDYAWSRTTGSAANIVAVIDTGIDATHEDLQNLNSVDGYDFINNQPIKGRVNSDDNGHGTLVAGVLGASANNGVGIVGTNWIISIMPLKALNSSGKGDSNSVAQAITWAADHGANFINLSLGGIGFGHDVTLSNAIAYAFNKGVLIVAAAGNDIATTGGNLDQNPVYPVCDDNGNNEVLGVAAVDQNGLKPEFSDYGSSCIDVVAPGKRILSTINHDPITGGYTPNSYAYASGTSLATPFVTGEAALIRALNPSATGVQIRDQILNTASPIDNLNLSQCGGQSCRGLLGSGEINVRAAVDKMIPQTAVQDGDLITLAPNSQVYQVVGNQKRLVSPFVMQQKFSAKTSKLVSPQQLAALSDGPYAAPQDGTLVKTMSSLAVYMMELGQKLPVSYAVFLQRRLGFSQVAVLSDAEVNGWPTGSLLPPSDGTLVRSFSDRTVYWVVGATLHPIDYNFYVQRGLSIFRIFLVSRQDLAGFPRGEAYIR